MYPEHEKIDKFSQEQNDAINEFIEYLNQNYDILNNFGHSQSGMDVYYKMLGVDKKKLEAERRQFLDLSAA